MPFNRHWTVHSERAGIASMDGAGFVGRLIDTVRRYATRHGYQMSALWVREDGEGKGGHVHILLHLPPSLSLRTLTVRWVRSAGGTYRAGVSHMETIGGGLNCAATNPEHYGLNMGEVLAYVLKAADPDTGRRLCLPKCDIGGMVRGKRIGWTQNIGVAARGSGSRNCANNTRARDMAAEGIMSQITRA